MIFNNKTAQGTLIEISDFKQKRQKNLTHLKRNLARRFAIIGDNYNFKVKVNDSEVKAEDREYYKKVQFVFTYADKGKDIKDKFSKQSCEIIDRTNQTDTLAGWIGTAKEPSNLKDDDGDNINKIALIVRGKVAEEDLLAHFQISGHIRHYLIGEIHADELDVDYKDDIATSNRQSINTEDDRFKNLLKNLQNEINAIRTVWEYKRGEKTQKDLFKRVPDIETWFRNLPVDAQKVANRLVTIIGQINENKRDILYRSIVPAIEQMKIRNNLSALENLTSENIETTMEVFKEHDRIEAHLFYEITRARLEVISRLLKIVEDNELEKVIQKYIFDHLWLLDPSWDRASTNTTLEESITTKLNGINVDGRIDIRYRRTSGEHIIIELKRPSVKPSIGTLIDQIKKYKKAVKENISPNEKVMIFIIVGSFSPDEDDISTLDAQGATIKTYRKVVENAELQYQEYLVAQKQYSEIIKLIESFSNIFGSD